MSLERWHRYVTQRTNLRLFLGVPVVAFLLLYGSFFLSYRGEQTSQEDIQARMNRLLRSAAAPTQRMQEVRTEYERLQQTLPAANLKETDVFEFLLAMTQEKGLDAQINYRSETTKKVDASSYRVLLFTLNVSGSFDRVWELVRELDAGPKGLETLVVEKVNIGLGEEGRASVDFAVYTQLPGVGTATK